MKRLPACLSASGLAREREQEQRCSTESVGRSVGESVWGNRNGNMRKQMEGRG